MSRTIIVTGASSGIGLAAAVQFAAAGDHVALVGRSPERLDRAAGRVAREAGVAPPARFVADFERLDDVRRLGKELLDAYPEIDVLVNNAGGLVNDYRRTTDGFEATVQSNHLAPFLLTGLLRERLRGGRVVNTASRAHLQSNLNPDDLTGGARTYRAWGAYGAGKAANILFAAEAARRWPDVLSVSFHPGVVRSNFGEHGGAFSRFFWRFAPFLTTPEAAGSVLTWLGTADGLTNGAYYVGRSETRPGPTARGPELASRLWEASARATGL